MKRLLLSLMLIILGVGYASANPARIISMGKSDQFFMDETSVLRFPGDVRYYSNMLIGELGTYMDTTKTTNFYLNS